MKSSDDCNLCELGRYQHERGKSHCNLCASGTYLNITGGSAASDCISCPSNAGNSTPGSIDMTDCKCNPGTSGVDGGPICNLCEIGKFTDVSGVSICSPSLEFQFVLPHHYDRPLLQKSFNLFSLIGVSICSPSSL